MACGELWTVGPAASKPEIRRACDSLIVAVVAVAELEAQPRTWAILALGIDVGAADQFVAVRRPTDGDLA